MGEIDFIAGQQVEVKTKDVDYQDCWFEAIVVRGALKRSKKKKKVFVEYKTLVDERISEPVREYVDLEQLRPCPPKDESNEFGLDQVVDAYHKLGWCKGVISEVLGGLVKPLRYVVYFSLGKEKVVFGVEELRVHQEWINGRWVSGAHELQKQIMEPRFKKGAAVEVSFDEESFRGAWLPATILVEISNNSFLVECELLSIDSSDTGKLTETVDLQHIRPSPPQKIEGRKFDVSEEVEAFYQFAWWNGLVTRVLADNRYAVFLKQQSELKEFKHSELRLCMDWTNGEWFQASHIQDSQALTSSNQDGSRTPDLEVANSGAVYSHFESQSNSVAQSATSLTNCSKRLKKGNESEATPALIADLARETSTGDSTREKEVIRQRSGENLTTPLRRSIRQTEKVQAKGVSSENQLAGTLQNSSRLGHDLQKTLVTKCSFSLEEGRNISDQSRNASRDEENDFFPLSIQMASTIETASFPFTKSSPLWQAVESMEALRLMPQQAHFHPLNQFNEELREGLAIGHMVNFASLVSKTRKAQLDEPKSAFENRASALRELEAYGFNVEPLQARIAMQLKLKSTQEQLDEKAKEIEQQLVEEKLVEDKLKAEVDEANKKLEELQECIYLLNKKRESTVKEMEIKGSNITELQERLNVIMEQARSTKLRFDSS